MRKNRPPTKRYITPVTADERMATMLLRNLRRMAKVGMGSPVSITDSAWLEAERDRLRQLRGHTGKKHRRAGNAQ